MRLRKILGSSTYVPCSFCDTDIINFSFTIMLMSASKLHMEFPPQFPLCSFAIYFMPLHPTILFKHKTLSFKLEFRELPTSPHPRRMSGNVIVRGPMLILGQTLFPISLASAQSLLVAPCRCPVELEQLHPCQSTLIPTENVSIGICVQAALQPQGCQQDELLYMAGVVLSWSGPESPSLLQGWYANQTGIICDSNKKRQQKHRGKVLFLVLEATVNTAMNTTDQAFEGWCLKLIPEDEMHCEVAPV